MLSDLTNLLIFFGGALALLMGFTQLLNPAHKTGNRLLCILLSCIGIIQLQQYYTVVYAGSPIEVGLQPIRFVKFLIGPALYLYFQYIFKYDYTIDKKKLLHFIPAAGAILLRILITITYYSNSSFLKNIYYTLVFYNIPFLFHSLGIVLISIYFIVILVKLRVFSFLSAEKKDSPVKISFAGICLALVILFLMILSLIYKEITVSRIAMTMLSLLVISIYIVGQIYPEFLHWFRKKIKKKRYERSLIEGLNLETLRTRLTELMEEEKLFYDEDLTLQKLAEHLSISSHQLSEFLNNQLKINFSTYINRFRVEEAKKILLLEPDRSILSTAFAVGFNTKSVFYDAFSKFTGMSPVKYRKIHGPNKTLKK
ncbi:MAG: AraC family transcriptional regulator [bacterium]|nr:AraC family transcriptional regulator [bacterium]